jgi:CarD family transcriptional regulator
MNLELAKLDFDNANQSHERRADLSVQTDGNSIKRPDNFLEFSPGEFVVYPAHGVGHILGIEVQTIAGASLEFFAIYFAKSKMRLHVPTRKARSVGMRKLSSSATIEKARLTLSEAPRRMRANWSRLINEYEAKIKSGNIIALAEATRDLYRPANSEQSYSERQLYTAALHRLAEEVGMVTGITEENAASELEDVLLTGLRRPQ